MQTEPILTETIASTQDILGADLDRITVERAVVGLFFTGVKPELTFGGTVCFRPSAAPAIDRDRPLLVRPPATSR